MNYYKIAELANLCETKRSIINEYYRCIGANGLLTKETSQAILDSINELESELQKLETKLRKEIV
jgi:hypothetical protein